MKKHSALTVRPDIMTNSVELEITAGEETLTINLSFPEAQIVSAMITDAAADLLLTSIYIDPEVRH